MDKFFVVFCDGCNKRLIDLKGSRLLTVETVYICDTCRKIWCRGCSADGLCPRCKGQVEKYEDVLGLLRRIIRWDTMRWRKFPLKKEGEDGKRILAIMPTRFFADDVKAKCNQCGIDVYMRPNSWKMAEEEGLEIVCIDCAKKIAEERKDYDVAITEKTIREVLEQFEGKDDWRKSYV